ncbi:MAG: bifunctional [glutamate--ammonia ligase]-adenylyl-L-tyrosine phosphorylase/[glutamate--ammonia-ligase] adenylyltransferase [Planctomycetes bacterium]|nr:bifunctional [glutamate--ammonia ligase]-adenylyl-L-tyrosine phosphorylase/[glutamate--ammonia-ligase] adenylyltransferase [Planctomycetota bacterium]
MGKGRDALFRMLDLGLPEDLPEDDLRALGFGEPARVKEGLARLRARVDIAKTFDLRCADILRAVAHSPDPDQAFAGLERWLDAGGAAVGSSPMDWCEEPFLELFCTLLACTPALSAHLIRFPKRTRPVLKPVLERTVRGGYAWLRQVRAAALAASGHKNRLAALRHARTEAMLQIAALDLLGVSKLPDTVRALSDLADACVETALELCAENLKQRFGALPSDRAAAVRPGLAPPPPFVVLAMGKHGGRELNYSSDIDLIFAFNEGGPTQGTGRSVERAEFFTQLGKEMIAALDQLTDDGRVYRVDMRLRPYGAAGVLACSTRELLEYLQSEGRTWERQAWLKARAVAGDLELGEQALRELEPFVYRRFLTLESIGDIQSLKRQIELNVARRGETRDEVKLGHGGIRDIEFTVQFLQLLHGGEHAAVRGGNTLKALRALRGEALLTHEEAERLEAAYVFLRQVEHRLQIHGDLQTHKLPADAGARRRIAKSLGYSDFGLGISDFGLHSPSKAEEKPESSESPAAEENRKSEIQNPKSAEDRFEAERQKHVARVREIFEKLFANLFREQEGPEGRLSELLLAPQPDLETIAALLPAFGFANAAETARELLALAHERVALTSASRTRKFFASLAPLLLRSLAATGEPDAALKRFSRIASSLGGKAVLYQSLHENPWLLKMISELASWSEYLTEILVANPGLFDEVIDALHTEQSKSQARMEQEIAQIAQGGDVSDTLRAYRAGELLRIGVRDLIHSAPLEQTQAELTALAEALLRAQFANTYKQSCTSRGVVVGESGKPVGFAILGLGKFGGGELNYGSDLDVLYFYGEEGAAPDGLPANPYFSGLAQDLSRAMDTPTAIGRLYQLDARLRPNGNKGPLASSLAAFERYWKDGSLADWERLAFTRARFAAGDAGVGERALHLIRSAVYSPLKSGNLAQEVREMRKRMEETTEGGDLKRGKGGLVDIEFLVQYLQLLHGPAFPPLRQTNTKDALKALLKFKKLRPPEGATLLEAYDFFSRMANRVRIVHGLSANKLPSSKEELQKLALRALYMDAPGKTAGEQLVEDYHRYAAEVRAIFERLVV